MSDDIHDLFDPDEAWSESEPEVNNEPPAPPRSRRTMRRRRQQQRRRRIIASIVIVVMVILIALGGVYGYQMLRRWRAHNAQQQTVAVADYEGPGTGDVAFTIHEGEGVLEIAQHLLQDDIIKSTDSFTSVVAANQLTLYPGTYELHHQMKASSVAAILSDQGNAKGFVEVRQGERVSEVVEYAVKASGLTQEDFEAYTNNKDKADTILPAEANGSFEGWLEPGVYNVGANPSAADLLKQMVQARISRLNELNVPQGSERERILIIASIVEAEVNSPEYYGKVSRVIENRLKDGMTLGMDSTVAYGFNMKGTELTNTELNDGSNPYNTRVNKGLPPTPISNPGDDAIEAAMHPTEGDWLYFVTTNLKTGETKFTNSYDQFEQYVQEYKQNNKDAN